MSDKIKKSLSIIASGAPHRPARQPMVRRRLDPKSALRQKAAQLKAQVTGASIELDQLNMLILNYTMACPLACDYCCYGCSPKRRETMDLALACDLVDQAAELGVFGQCGFTGGEPLLYYEDVMTLGERMKRAGMPFSMISSCYFATTPEEARRVMRDLRSVGMAVFTATHDPSHEKWVPDAYIRNTIDAAREEGVHVCLCASFYDDTKRLQQIFPEYDGTDVDIVNRVVLPDVGNSARRNIGVDAYPNATSRDHCYKRVFHDLTVFWDGEVYPCCSVYNRATPALSLGNAYERTLADIWDRLEGSLLYRTIKANSFEELYRIVRRYRPDAASRLPSRDVATGPCHLCHLVFRDAELATAVFDAVDKHERATVEELLAVVSRQQGIHARQDVIRECVNR